MTTPATRARGLLARGGWIDVARADGTYALRLGADRRGRAALTLDETTFRALVEEPGLKARPGGGWLVRPPATRSEGPAPGLPGRIEGERPLMEPDGRLILRRANLGESPIAWLMRRKGPDGRPWLTPDEAAVGERLRLDAEIAGSGPSLTMRWDALPRAGGGGSASRPEPGDRALAAGRRVARALNRLDPRQRAVLVRICLAGSSLQLAEQEAGLRRREGKRLLKAGLQTLARHYCVGEPV